MVRLRIALASLAVSLLLSACAAQPSPTPPAPGPSIIGPVPEVICDPAPVPPVSLNCDAAIGAAMTALGQGPWAIQSLRFHYGFYCAPGAPCASPPPNLGYVEVRLRGQGAELMVSIEINSAGLVIGSSPVPYPPTPVSASIGPSAIGPAATPPETEIPMSAPLPNPGGTCTGSQFVLGQARSGFTFSTALTRHAYFVQPLRNAGSACVLSVPKLFAVASASGPFQPVKVINTGNEVCVSNACHYVTPASYTIRPGQTLEIDFSVSWWVGGTDQSGTPLYSAPPCGGRVMGVSRVEFPAASGAIVLDLEASVREAGSSVPWHEVCSSPPSISFDISPA